MFGLDPIRGAGFGALLGKDRACREGKAEGKENRCHPPERSRATAGDGAHRQRTDGAKQSSEEWYRELRQPSDDPARLLPTVSGAVRGKSAIPL